MKKLTKEEAEYVLAVVIDDLYLDMRDNFVDYKNQTHSLGFFKERVKQHFSMALREYDRKKSA